VAGHAAATGLLLLGAWGLPFLAALPLVVWARVSAGAHTLAQTFAGAGVGAAFAVAFLV
jgi:membrane-associated phospholipid phosphatase